MRGLHQLVELRALVLGARVALVDELADDMPAALTSDLSKLVELELRILIARRDAGVEGNTGPAACLRIWRTHSVSTPDPTRTPRPDHLPWGTWLPRVACFNRTIHDHLHVLSGSATLRRVPKVDTFSVAGLVLRFYSNDHTPPHFHAEKLGHWEVRLLFRRDPTQMIEFVTKKKPRPAELKELKRLAELHRIALLVEWEAKVSITTPGADQ